jgi:hypothetical protein
MLRYAAAENSNNDILRGLRRRDDRINIVRVQDLELSAGLDPILLDWATRENRIVLSHEEGTSDGRDSG